VEVIAVPRRHLAPGRFGDLSGEVAFGVQALGRLGAVSLDVWHALGTSDAAASALLAGARRTMTSVYTDLGFPARASREARSDRRLHEFVVRHVDTYVCLSVATGEHLRSGYGREPVVVGGGVDTSRFVPAPSRSRVPSLLFAGAASEPRKNLALLFEAVAQLVRTTPVELWLATPDDPTALVATAPEAARAAVRHVPTASPSDLVALYGSAWVTVTPYEAEAFGLVAVESLACGTPVVALEDTAPAELIGPGTGLTTPPTATDLAAALRRAVHLAAEPATSDACRALAVDHHDWRGAVVPRLEQLYRAGR